MTAEHREWVERLYALISESTPKLSIDKIMDPNPDTDPDAAMLYVLQTLMLPNTSESQRKRAVTLAEHLADDLLREYRPELIGYVYGQRPDKWAQLLWFVCLLAGIELVALPVLVN